MKNFFIGASLLAASFPFVASAYAVIDLTPTAFADEVLEVSSVEASYRETGHILALMPVTFTARALVYASGEVKLEYPWYSSFTVDREETVATEIKVAVDRALRKLLVGSVWAEGGLPRTTFTKEEASAVSTAMKRVLQENFGAKSGL